MCFRKNLSFSMRYHSFYHFFVPSFHRSIIPSFHRSLVPSLYHFIIPPVSPVSPVSPALRSFKPYPFNASAPPTISSISLVMAAWRALLYESLSSLSKSCALSVALCIAVIRAPCSEAVESSSAL